MEGGGETGEGAQQDAVPVHEEHGAVESEGRVPDGAQTSSEQENDPEYSGASGKDLWDRVREYLKAGRLVAPENADEFFQRRERRKAMVAWFSAVDGVFEQKRLVDLTAIAQNYTVANNTPDAVSNMRAKQALYNSFAPPKPTSFESSIIDWLSSTMHRVPAFVNRMVRERKRAWGCQGRRNAPRPPPGHLFAPVADRTSGATPKQEVPSSGGRGRTSPGQSRPCDPPPLRAERPAAG